MFNKMRILIISIVVMLVISAPNISIAGNELEAAVIGVWKSDSITKENIRILMTVEFFRNGTCKTQLMYINLKGKFKTYTFSEYWSVNERHINYEIYESSDKSLIGGKTSVTVVAFDQNKITLRNSDGHISDLVRVK